MAIALFAQPGEIRLGGDVAVHDHQRTRGAFKPSGIPARIWPSATLPAKTWERHATLRPSRTGPRVTRGQSLNGEQLLRRLRAEPFAFDHAAFKALDDPEHPASRRYPAAPGARRGETTTWTLPQSGLTDGQTRRARNLPRACGARESAPMRVICIQARKGCRYPAPSKHPRCSPPCGTAAILESVGFPCWHYIPGSPTPVTLPGHRANLLNREVREIGVGLLRDGGITAGRPLARLYAVQLFGKPLSDCGELPSDRDRAAIEEVDGRLELLNARLRDRRRELDDLQTRIDRASGNTERNRWIQERNQRVGEFNQLVAEAKGVQGTLSVMIDTFNAKLADFNACGAGT